MIDKRLGRSWWRRIEPPKRKLGRDELVARLAVAENKAGRAWKMIDVTMPKEGDKVTAESFSWKLNWPRIWEARDEDEGTYLLRTNLPECDPKTLWTKYMIQGEIEYAFRELKNDLGAAVRRTENGRRNSRGSARPVVSGPASAEAIKQPR